MDKVDMEEKSQKQNYASPFISIIIITNVLMQ